LNPLLKLPLEFTDLACSFLGSFNLIKLATCQSGTPLKLASEVGRAF